MSMTIATMGIIIVAKHMMIRITIMRVEARDIGAVVLTSVEEAEVLLVGETGAPLGKEAKRGVQKLSNGIKKRKKLNKLRRHRLTLVTTMMVIIINLHHMVKRTMVTSSRYHNVRRDMDIDQLMTCWQSSYAQA
ncbi:hypothetical protein BVRB_4g094580 isoform B [Beta vulgaris subsp. vulgaris]|nr:hypothetical protein BVRB_4g094580 isoform B [Beta vulgaris subsp. vulgaris]